MKILIDVPTPLAFFTEVIPNAGADVTRLVAAVLRHTLGMQAQEWHATAEDVMRASGISSRAGLAAALLEAQSAGYVVAEEPVGPSEFALRPAWEGEKTRAPIVSLGFAGDTAGYVYLIYCETGHYKIGAGKDPVRRLNGLGLPLPASLIKVIPADDMYAAEADLHRRFGKLLVRSEWYELRHTDVALVRGLCAFTDGSWSREAPNLRGEGEEIGETV